RAGRVRPLGGLRTDLADLVVGGRGGRPRGGAGARVVERGSAAALEPPLAAGSGGPACQSVGGCADRARRAHSGGGDGTSAASVPVHPVAVLGGIPPRTPRCC